MLTLVLTTVGCDQLTKRVATTSLEGVPPKSYLADTFRLEYVTNSGSFLGLGADLPPAVRTGVLTVGAALALVALMIVVFRSPWSGLPSIGAVLFVGGGASNVVDRVAQGSVVDFINVGLGPIRTGIFNVADVALMMGLALIVLGGTLETWATRRERSVLRRAAEQPAVADRSRTFQVEPGRDRSRPRPPRCRRLR